MNHYFPGAMKLARAQGLLVFAFATHADVFWNPGDRILRHNAEFEAAKAHFASTIQLNRVECPPRLEDEITYVNNRYAKPNASAERRHSLTNISAPAVATRLVQAFPMQPLDL